MGQNKRLCLKCARGRLVSGKGGAKIIREEAVRERVSRRKRGKDTIFRIQKLITALCEC